MSSTKKGNDWYFGLPLVVCEQTTAGQWKAHIGVDADSGIVHSLDTSTAKLHDGRIWDDLLHSGETSVWADKAYVSAGRAEAFAGPGKFWGVMRKAPKGGALHPDDDCINHLIAKVRAKVEHPFRVLKRQFDYIKSRYCGLSKNRAQLFCLFALGNLYHARRQLMT